MTGWHDTWPAWRHVLRRMHAVSAAKARGGPGAPVYEPLRELAALHEAGRGPLGDIAIPQGLSSPDRGRLLFTTVAEGLRPLVPVLPVEPDDADALVRLWWWCWSCLGMTGAELEQVTLSRTAVRQSEEGTWKGLKAATIESRMWRRQGRPPSGASASALERLDEALTRLPRSASTNVAFESLWIGCAVMRLRLLEPAALAFVAMLGALADEPIDLTELPGRHHHALAPVALIDACMTRRSLVATMRRTKAVGLVDFKQATVRLVDGARPVLHAGGLTPKELDRGALSAVVALHGLFPSLYPRTPDVIPPARLLLAHAYAAAEASERRDIGEGWRDNLLERVCVLEYETGSFDAAAEAGRRAVNAAEVARRHGTELTDKLVNYADALGKIDRLDDAIAVYLRALDETERTLVDRAMTLNGYGALLRRARREDEALTAHREALALIRSWTPLDAQRLAEVLHDTSLAAHAKGDFRQALELLQEAESSSRRPTTACLIEIRMVEAYNGLREFHEAERLGRRAMEHAQGVFGRVSADHLSAIAAYGRALEGVADISGHAADRRRALEAWDRYVRLREQVEEDGRSDV